MLAEKAAWEFAEENSIDLVTVIPAPIAENSLLSVPRPSSSSLSMSLITEKETASGRYICCAYNTSVPNIADFLKQRYPKYKVISEFDECLSIAKLTLSSEKLINEGFRFEYGISEMYDEMIEYFESKGLIEAKQS